MLKHRLSPDVGQVSSHLPILLNLRLELFIPKFFDAFLNLRNERV